MRLGQPISTCLNRPCTNRTRWQSRCTPTVRSARPGSARLQQSLPAKPSNPQCNESAVDSLIGCSSPALLLLSSARLNSALSLDHLGAVTLWATVNSTAQHCSDDWAGLGPNHFCALHTTLTELIGPV